jgi:hypothetical protein
MHQVPTHSSAKKWTRPRANRTPADQADSYANLVIYHPHQIMLCHVLPRGRAFTSSGSHRRYDRACSVAVKSRASARQHQEVRSSCPRSVLRTCGCIIRLLVTCVSRIHTKPSSLCLYRSAVLTRQQRARDSRACKKMPYLGAPASASIFDEAAISPPTRQLLSQSRRNKKEGG